MSNTPANETQPEVSKALDSIRKARAAIEQSLSDERSTVQREARRIAQTQVTDGLRTAQEILRKLISTLAPVPEAETALPRAALLAIDDANAQVETAFGDKLDRARSDARKQLRGLLSDAERELSNEILRARDEAEALEKIAAGLAKGSAE